MQFTWTADEIKPGIVVGKPGRDERWMIGYAPFVHDGEKRYTLNSMSDGMVRAPVTKTELAAHLTDSNEHPSDVLDNPIFGFRKWKP